MAEIPKVEKPTGSMLEYLISEDRKRGLSWHDIGKQRDVDPDEAYRIYVQYREKDAGVNEAEYRMLQLERLEKMIDALWDLAVESKSIDHIKALLPVLQEISKLLGLNKQKAITEVRVIEQRQVHLVVDYIDAVTETVKRHVLELMPNNLLRDEIENGWDSWVAQASEKPLAQIESSVIEV